MIDERWRGERRVPGIIACELLFARRGRERDSSAIKSLRFTRFGASRAIANSPETAEKDFGIGF